MMDSARIFDLETAVDQGIPIPAIGSPVYTVAVTGSLTRGK